MKKKKLSFFNLSPSFFSRLHRWFLKNRRDLPWRKNRNPYRVWIAEVMLQQTQSETVKPYYQKWMKTFPTLKSLSSNLLNRYNKLSLVEKVLSLWQGLGYYKRAINILNTAEKLIRDHQGRFPKNRKTLLSLPGIGPYTAGAILNFGFTSATPSIMVDGNFIRVVSRLFHLNSKQARNSRTIWQIAEALLSCSNNHHPRQYNEAMMEIGSLICKPINPLCNTCPLRINCVSWKQGKSKHNPYTLSKKLIPVFSTSLILRQKGRYLLMKSPKQGLNTILWRFPTVDRYSQMERLNRGHNSKQYQNLFQTRLGVDIEFLQYRFSIRHHYTKYRIDLEVWEGNGKVTIQDKSLKWKWFSLKDLITLGMSSPDQKIRKFIVRSLQSNIINIDYDHQHRL